jgi:hypothetical protein
MWGFSTREALQRFDQLPLLPGALMESRPPQSPNALYDPDVTLIFYDDPNFGRYPRWFRMIREDPTRFDLLANLRRVLAQYRAARRPEESDTRLQRLLEDRANWIEARISDITTNQLRH